ncbi:MAG: hypothetical protein A2135_01745 [Actinobacteria bacterium RBG_16_67_15]|nr:MAG: hypothetical protein A2135_01745 [Actinobacteria bacterium RBG_16_67_15]
MLVTVAGGMLGAATGYSIGDIGGLAVGAVMAGLNGGFGGLRGTYAWRTIKGWFAFVSDSSWGLLGTTLGVGLNVINSASKASGYREDFSRRQNRHVFERGACMKRGFAFTHGNVISNAATGHETLTDERRDFIDRHEGLHVWQNRIFGPIYQAGYVGWFLLGALVAMIAKAFRRNTPPLRRLVETAAYYDNPFEYWAYRRDDHWETNGAEPMLKWRSRPRS